MHNNIEKELAKFALKTPPPELKAKVLGMAEKAWQGKTPVIKKPPFMLLFFKACAVFVLTGLMLSMLLFTVEERKMAQTLQQLNPVNKKQNKETIKLMDDLGMDENYIRLYASAGVKQHPKDIAVALRRRQALIAEFNRNGG